MRHFLFLTAFTFLIIYTSAQINELIPPAQFGVFDISSTIKTIDGRHFLFVNVTKANQLIITDSVTTDVASCQGFSVPLNQPFKNYFVFSKHETKSGKTYVLSIDGDFAVVAGGTFWAAPKDKLLFILAEKDYLNLAVFNLKEMKTIFEKFSCDEFTDWYYRKGNYFGNVTTECGSELKQEKEVSEWMRPAEIEQFDPKLRTLEEMHITNEQLENAHRLIKYAACN